MLIGFLGCIMSGHPYVPLDRSFPEQRVQSIMETAGAAMLLTPDEIRSQSEGEPPAPPANHCMLDADDPWYIMFTSGSTGEPKGVVITRGCLESFVGWILREQKFTELQDVFLNQAPFSFDLSIMDVYSSLATGGTLYSLTSEQTSGLRHLYGALEASKLSVWVSTPSFARMCLMDPAFSQQMLPQVRKFWFCGETLAPEVAGDLLQRFPKAEVWNTYGPTEATVATTSIQVTAEVLAKYRPLPVGRPKPGTTVLIQDAEGNPVPDGDKGQVIIVGPNVSTGYLHRSDLSLRSFFEHNGQRAYRTGDWGHYDDDLLFFDGRMDSQIKLRGYRIEIGDVEANLAALPGVRDAVVVPSEDKGRVDHLVAFVILREKPSSDFEAMRRLKTMLSGRLPDYMVPRRFVFVSEFPMTDNGKVSRQALANSLK